MSFTTPFTAVAGTAWKASDWNTYGRDDIAWLATDSPACRAYNNAAISLANGVTTAITLNSERYDNAAVHSTSSNTSRFTVPTGAGGKYMFMGNVAFAANGTGVRAINGRLNGTTTLSENSYAPAAASIFDTEISFCTVYALSAADYVEMTAFQTSGGALNATLQSNSAPEASIIWFRT